ncbi:MAG: hypothetical protein ACOYLK_09770 [Sphingomonas sp.]
MAGCENVTIAVTDCARHGSCEVSGQFWRHFDRRREDLWQSAVAGAINRIDCGKCGRRFVPPEQFLYTDTERNFAIVVSPTPLDGQVAPDDFPEVLLAVEARLTSSALLETKALLAAYTDTKIDPASLRLVGIDNVLSFQNENGSMIELLPKTGHKVMAQQDIARQTLANRRARRRRHIGDRNKAAADFLAAFSQKGLVNDFDDEIAAVKAAIAQGYFTRDQAYAMARLARKPQAHQFDRAQSFALFEDITGIELSDELENAKARAGLPVLAALWYAYAQLPDKARRWRGLGLEEVNGFQSEAIGGAFDTGSSAADPDKVLLSFGAIESSLFAPVLRHELAHALHDSNLELIDRWLTDNFGWRVYQLPMDAIGDEAMLTAAVEGWIEQLGGWDVAAPGATTEAEKRMVRFKIWQACQPLDAPRPGKTMSRWNDDLAGDPQWFGASLPQQAYVRSPDDWWRHAVNWLPLPGNPERVTFMCYQYRQLIVVDSSAVDLVSCGAIPNRYALMSQKEFFAELYTCWHWRRNGAESPRRLVRTQVPAFRDLLGEL